MIRTRILAACLLLLAASPVSAAPAATGASAAVAASAPARAAPHFRKDAQGAGAQLMAPYEMLAGLVLIAAAAWWWRRLGTPGRAGDDRMQVIDKCRLSMKSTVYVLHHRDREIVLVEHEHGVTTIRDDLKS